MMQGHSAKSHEILRSLFVKAFTKVKSNFNQPDKKLGASHLHSDCSNSCAVLNSKRKQHSTNKVDSRPRHLEGKGCKHCLVRQT